MKFNHTKPDGQKLKPPMPFASEKEAMNMPGRWVWRGALALLIGMAAGIPAVLWQAADIPWESAIAAFEVQDRRQRSTRWFRGQVPPCGSGGPRPLTRPRFRRPTVVLAGCGCVMCSATPTGLSFRPRAVVAYIGEAVRSRRGSIPASAGSGNR